MTATLPEQVFQVMLRMRVATGAQEAFDAALADVAQVAADNRHNLQQWIMRSADDPSEVLVFSDWDSEEAFRSHEATHEHRAAVSALRRHRAEGSMTTSRVVHQVAKANPPARPVRVMVWYYAGDTDEATIRAAHRQIETSVCGTPGLVKAELHRSLSAPDEYLVISEWSDVAAFREWEVTAVHRVQTAPLRPYLDRRRSQPYGFYEILSVDE
ncbi:MAG TPA: antibiotic biosynthesis monooxygenase [Rugosimonospora sp.]|nr:antibiotic biosynthesis monooxygenase [Rugosimonospora sp.]